MPQLTDRFGPIPSSVVLNGSGNGQLTFQANGSNARITNLYVNVSTSVAQAVCTIYKGQVATSNIIDSTNSGSTGASAKGAIDLMDGETLIVVWTGGDAGATAFATFTGVVVPFDQIGPSSITWADPIAAGDGSLIYPQMKSPDYVAGVSGWAIKRDGSVEFSNATVRGTVIAGNGNVVLDANGIDVKDAASAFEYIISRTSGFVAKNFPDNGAKVQINSSAVLITPATPTPKGNDVTFPGFVFTHVTNPSGVVERVDTQLASPKINGRPSGFVLVEGESTAGDVTKITLSAADLHITGYVEDHDLHDIRDHEYLRGENGAFLMSFAGVSSAAVVVTFTNTFSQAPQVVCNIDSAAGPTALWHVRATAITASQFTLFAFQGAGAVGTWSNIRVSWLATEFTP